MRQTWRWFGPVDTVSLQDVAQAGAQGVVSALHEVPTGQVWALDAIATRQRVIKNAGLGLTWDVVESLPVSEDIKRQQGDWRAHIANYNQSLANLAQSGIATVCYNFMPILDWTRTELRYALPNGARCMRFDAYDFAVFDIHILQRDGAAKNYETSVLREAERRFAAMDDDQARALVDNVICGLPGSQESYSLSALRDRLTQYDGIDAERLKKHQLDFLSEIVPTAEKYGMRLCCHPDDPPFALMGLPRIMSTEADYRALTTAINSPANGITLCSGSLGVRADNDLPGMVERLGAKIHFVHLRNVIRETQHELPSFYEAEHLGGETDMVALIGALLNEEKSRKQAGRSDWELPFRPDHGQDILSDLDANNQPGYPAVGRLKGLAELRGVMHALS